MAAGMPNRCFDVKDARWLHPPGSCVFCGLKWKPWLRTAVQRVQAGVDVDQVPRVVFRLRAWPPNCCTERRLEDVTQPRSVLPDEADVLTVVVPTRLDPPHGRLF